jgi:hypothetical protein
LLDIDAECSLEPQISFTTTYTYLIIKVLKYSCIKWERIGLTFKEEENNISEQGDAYGVYYDLYDSFFFF